MKSTFKTLFYLKKNEPKKNGHVVIMVRITVDGDQVQFSSKLDIHPDNWDTKTGTNRVRTRKKTSGYPHLTRHWTRYVRPSPCTTHA